jgi:hypothetical protein
MRNETTPTLAPPAGRKSPSAGELLDNWLAIQALNLDRQARSLRAFDHTEFGTGPTAPSPAQIDAVNEFLGTLRAGAVAPQTSSPRRQGQPGSHRRRRRSAPPSPARRRHCHAFSMSRVSGTSITTSFPSACPPSVPPASCRPDRRRLLRSHLSTTGAAGPGPAAVQLRRRGVQPGDVSTGCSAEPASAPPKPVPVANHPATPTLECLGSVQRPA